MVGTGRCRGVCASAVALAVLATGCELRQITLVQADDQVVAEVNAELIPELGGRNRLTAFLHRTLDPSGVRSEEVPGATVVVRRQDGATIELAPAALDVCVSSTPVGGSGSCYRADPGATERLVPGEHLGVTITLSGGGTLTGETTVPGDFALRTPAQEGYCRLPPETPFEVLWSSSQGAWAYVDEMLVTGLRDALAPQGIKVEQDPLYLLGLSVSATDTTIVLPGEFGAFDRFELDRDLSLALQKGLPAGTGARVTITATDRNYSNWERGGSFNPSGRVRIPSLQGDGTGVFAASLTRFFDVVVSQADENVELPSCVGG